MSSFWQPAKKQPATPPPPPATPQPAPGATPASSAPPAKPMGMPGVPMPMAGQVPAPVPMASPVSLANPSGLVKAGGTATAPMNPALGSPPIQSITPLGGIDQNKASFNKMMQDYQGTLADTLAGIRADESRAGRGMAAMNALGGKSVGGAFAGGMATTAIGGMQQEAAARNQHALGALQLKMTYLQQQLQQAENSKDRDLHKYIQDQINQTQLDIASMSAESPNEPPDQKPDADKFGLGAVTSIPQSIKNTVKKIF